MNGRLRLLILNQLVKGRAVVVAQLVERSLPTAEIRGSNPNIGKVLTTNCKLHRKDENKEKRPGMPHLKKIGQMIALKV